MATHLLETPVETIDGEYVMRPATLDDVPDAVAMFNACTRQLLGVDEHNVDDYRLEWQIPGLNLDTDVRVVVAPGGRLVGCIEVWDLSDPHVRVNVWGHVHPEHQGRGIGLAMLGWAEGRARRAIAQAPEGARVFMTNPIIGADHAAAALLDKAGFRLIRHGWKMQLDLDPGTPPAAPEWPDGIVVRPMRVERDERATVQAVRDAFRDHWGHVEQPFAHEFERWSHFMRNDPNFDASIWFLAWDGDAIAGVSLCWPKAHSDPDMGWVGTLGVLRPWRRRGLGLALLRHSFGEFYRRGKQRVGLGVDAQSLTGATRLYERAGMRVARVYNTYEKELRSGKDLSTQSVE
jgi:mycothiol synthase